MLEPDCFLRYCIARLRNFAALPSFAYFSANLAYFSFFSVSICAKLERNILMKIRNTATEPKFRKSLSKCRYFVVEKQLLVDFARQSTNTAAGLERSIMGVPTSDSSFYTVFQKKFTLLLFAITKSDVDRFQ